MNGGRQPSAIFRRLHGCLSSGRSTQEHHSRLSQPSSGWTVDPFFGAFRCLLKLKWRRWRLTSFPQDLWSSASSLWFRVTLDSSIQTADGNQERWKVPGAEIWTLMFQFLMNLLTKSGLLIIDWDEDDLQLFCGFRIRQQHNTTWQNWCENAPIVANAAINFMSSGTLKVALWIPEDIASLPEGRQTLWLSYFNIYTLSLRTWML